MADYATFNANGKKIRLSGKEQSYEFRKYTLTLYGTEEEYGKTQNTYDEEVGDAKARASDHEIVATIYNDECTKMEQLEN